MKLARVADREWPRDNAFLNCRKGWPHPSKCWRGGCAAIPSIGGGVVVWSPFLQLDGAGLDNHSTITSHNRGGDCMITLDAIDGYGHPPLQ
jgi:hypothetical protein